MVRTPGPVRGDWGGGDVGVVVDGGVQGSCSPLVGDGARVHLSVAQRVGGKRRTTKTTTRLIGRLRHRYESSVTAIAADAAVEGLHCY